MARLADGINLESPEKSAPREQFGKTLVELGAEYPQIVVLDADLACSTQTQHFAKAYPDRFFNQGIAEADMMCTAAGLATTGKIPFVSTFALFASGRAWDQVRNTICYSNLNVKIAPTHSGISLGEDGASHQSIEDIALMRVIPNMTVMIPSDSVETEHMIRWAVTVHGPMYIRLIRPSHAIIHDPATYQWTPYKIEVMQEGSDITLCATGEMVYHALLAAKWLNERDGFSADVLNCQFIKPFDSETLAKSAQKTRRVLTIESHQYIAGLGGAVAESISEHAPTHVWRMGTLDRFGQSGKPQDLFKEYGLDAESIYQKARTMIQTIYLAKI